MDLTSLIWDLGQMKKIEVILLSNGNALLELLTFLLMCCPMRICCLELLQPFCDHEGEAQSTAEKLTLKLTLLNC